MTNKLEYLSALEIGNLVNNKKITASEVIEYFINRIERINPSINAFTYTKFDEARLVAKKIDDRINKGEYIGPFAGVPFALKDFLPNKVGWTSSYGGVPSIISVDEENSIFCQAMEKAGGIAIGKTNAPSFGFKGTTDNKLYGPTKNPFNLKYNAGGSSGGSAAAVSSGLVPIAEGGDAGGSIRIPASWTNCYGFKASVGTIPSVTRPDAYSASHPYCFNGAITKTVLDSAALLNYMAKYDPKDPLSTKRVIDDYTKELNRPIKGLKIALTYDFDLFPVDEEIKETIKSIADKLRRLGVQVDLINFAFHYSKDEFTKMWLESICIDTALEGINKVFLYDIVNDPNNELPKEFIYWNKKVSKWDINNYYQYNLMKTDIYDAFQNVFDSYDIIISPVTSCLPVLNKKNGNTKGPKTINNIKMEQLIGFSQTFLINFIGNSAAAVPAGLSKKGLPIGVQVIGKIHDDLLVLNVSKVLEDINPWMSYYLKSIK